MEIFDLMGRRIGLLSDNTTFHKGTHTASFDTTQWPDGLYWHHLRTRGNSFVQKFIKTSASR